MFINFQALKKDLLLIKIMLANLKLHFHLDFFSVWALPKVVVALRFTHFSAIQNYPKTKDLFTYNIFMTSRVFKSFRGYLNFVIIEICIFLSLKLKQEKW